MQPDLDTDGKEGGGEAQLFWGLADMIGGGIALSFGGGWGGK